MFYERVMWRLVVIFCSSLLVVLLIFVNKFVYVDFFMISEMIIVLVVKIFEDIIFLVDI